jgi:hypothetical protein
MIALLSRFLFRSIQTLACLNELGLTHLHGAKSDPLVKVRPLVPRFLIFALNIGRLPFNAKLLPRCNFALLPLGKLP